MTLLLTPIFEWLAPVSVLVVGLAAVHLRFWPPKLGHIAAVWS
jgi:hypothetical protein